MRRIPPLSTGPVTSLDPALRLAAPVATGAESRGTGGGVTAGAGAGSPEAIGVWGCGSESRKEANHRPVPNPPE